MRRQSAVCQVGAIVLLVSVVCGCASSPASSGSAGAQPTTPAQARPKAVTLAIQGSVQGFGLASPSTPTGGWLGLTELHTDGLITGDFSTLNPIGRLATSVPTLDDGSISLLPDGRERVVFHLRPGVLWQDGEPFTSDDLVFSYQFTAGPTGMPTGLNYAVPHMDSVEAPDPATFIVNYTQPYYLGADLGPLSLWPLPKHLLEPVYTQYQATGSLDDLLKSPFWTSSFISNGPFRATSFDPGAGMEFVASDSYFLGKPHLDAIHVKIYSDLGTLLASVLAGTVDLVPNNVLSTVMAQDLQQRWQQSGDGAVLPLPGVNLKTLQPQIRPSVMVEPAILDPQVRRALFQALDREELAQSLQGSSDLAAWSWASSSDQFYNVTPADVLRAYPYDPSRSLAILQEAGWTQASDGTLHSTEDGRPFRTALQATPGHEQEISAYADYWRKLGLQVDEFNVPAAQVRNNEFVYQYPGWEYTGGAFLDLMTRRGATAENHWVGNAGGYDDAAARDLAHAFQSSISTDQQRQTMTAAISYLDAQLPALPIYFDMSYRVERKGVNAFEDAAATNSGPPFAGASRNASIWDVTQ